MSVRQVSKINRAKLIESGGEGTLTRLTFDIIFNSPKPLTRAMISKIDPRLKVNCVPQFVKNLMDKNLVEENQTMETCEATGNLAHYLRAVASTVKFNNEK